MDLFDLATSREARDNGMALVTGHNGEFKAAFRQRILALPHGWQGTCEDIRRDWSGPTPKHPNSWGACWSAAKRDGLLVELDEQVQMTSVKSHARKTHLHRRIAKGG